jgi:hypothetical protein
MFTRRVAQLQNAKKAQFAAKKEIERLRCFAIEDEMRQLSPSKPPDQVPETRPHAGRSLTKLFSPERLDGSTDNMPASVSLRRASQTLANFGRRSSSSMSQKNPRGAESSTSGYMEPHCLRDDQEKAYASSGSGFGMGFDHDRTDLPSQNHVIRRRLSHVLATSPSLTGHAIPDQVHAAIVRGAVPGRNEVSNA